jgi:hypothetical protein
MLDGLVQVKGGVMHAFLTLVSTNSRDFHAYMSCLMDNRGLRGYCDSNHTFQLQLGAME